MSVKIMIAASMVGLVLVGFATGYHFGNERAVRLEKACFDETYDDSRETAKFLPQ